MPGSNRCVSRSNKNDTTLCQRCLVMSIYSSAKTAVGCMREQGDFLKSLSPSFGDWYHTAAVDRSLKYR
eukprot:scaffold46129_cov153-Amphora_coffeaeformis.AAC.3